MSLTVNEMLEQINVIKTQLEIIQKSGAGEMEIYTPEHLSVYSLEIDIITDSPTVFEQGTTDEYEMPETYVELTVTT